ncbi:MAG: capsular polysaccharide biosynthesis protein [Pseudomonadota bacterium]
MDIRIAAGLPFRSSDKVMVWGRKIVARRGISIAAGFQRDLVTVEDAFLRSVKTGREGDPPLGMIWDEKGIYFDADANSTLEDYIEMASADGFDLGPAKMGIERLRHLNLSKYNAFSLDTPQDLPPHYVLVIDQTRNDMAIQLGKADAHSFKTMLADAKAKFQDLPILIKCHPETIAGKKKGHFSKSDEDPQVKIWTKPFNPWCLLERAEAVFTVTSQSGLEAIFAGHKPHVYGVPFYAGRGLTVDHNDSCPKRPDVSPEILYAAAYQLYSKYFDPFSEGLTTDQRTAYTLAAQARAARQKSKAVFLSMRLWKRTFLRRYLGTGGALFTKDLEAAFDIASKNGAPVYFWAGQFQHRELCALNTAKVPLAAVEDGFIRSFGLGAALIRPVSLCVDWTGIYYDPNTSSDCEKLINASVDLPTVALDRARELRHRIVELNITKYNLKDPTDLQIQSDGKEILLVTGQVEDDASVVRGSVGIKSNDALLRRVRRDFPDSYIVYKPHPDVVAGLRAGHIADADRYADLVLKGGDISTVLRQVDKVATITSLTGFEALMREKTVICYGAPFYAGWGLTVDKGPMPDRRRSKLTLDHLVHAALIDYPLYWDPISGKPCAPETVLDRFEARQFGSGGGPLSRVLSKAQGALISYGPFWR